MKKPIPLIKFNDGKPIALCNRCFRILCYVSCLDNDVDDYLNCVVIDKMNDNESDYISTPLGSVPPPYCDTCNQLFTYSLNE